MKNLIFVNNMWKHIKSHLYSKSGAKVYKIAQIHKKCAIIYAFNTKKKTQSSLFHTKKGYSNQSFYSTSINVSVSSDIILT